jgi:hypothetical protein
MVFPIVTRWLKGRAVAAAVLGAGLLAAGGAVAPAEAQYLYPPYTYGYAYPAMATPIRHTITPLIPTPSLTGLRLSTRLRLSIGLRSFIRPRSP